MKTICMAFLILTFSSTCFSKDKELENFLNDDVDYIIWSDQFNTQGIVYADCEAFDEFKLFLLDTISTLSSDVKNIKKDKDVTVERIYLTAEGSETVEVQFDKLYLYTNGKKYAYEKSRFESLKALNERRTATGDEVSWQVLKDINLIINL